MTALVIPNKEIQWIFEEQIQEWFETEARKDIQMLENFCRAFEENDTAARPVSPAKNVNQRRLHT